LKFDYISDLHIENNGLRFLEELIKTKDSEYIFLGGDISENIEDLIIALKFFSENYKKVFYIPGNHELLKPLELSLEEKYLKLKNIVESINENIIFFDGQVLNIEGIKISGLTMWYDASYLRSKLFYLNEEDFISYINKYYNSFMIDSQYFEKDLFYNFKFFKNKLDLINEDIDIMFSHISPLNLEEFTSIRFKGSDTNAFFSFNGRDFLIKNKVKVYLYGHTHDSVNTKYGYTRILANPYGYLNETNFSNRKIENFEFHK